MFLSFVESGQSLPVGRSPLFESSGEILTSIPMDHLDHRDIMSQRMVSHPPTFPPHPTPSLTPPPVGGKVVVCARWFVWVTKGPLSGLEIFQTIGICNSVITWRVIDRCFDTRWREGSRSGSVSKGRGRGRALGTAPPRAMRGPGHPPQHARRRRGHHGGRLHPSLRHTSGKLPLAVMFKIIGYNQINFL